jgi:hypothetical protein
MQEENIQQDSAQQLAPKSQNIKFIIPIIVLAVLTLGLGGWLAYEKINTPKCETATQPNGSNDNTANNTEERTVKPTTPETILAAYGRAMGGLDGNEIIKDTTGFGQYSSIDGNFGEAVGITTDEGQIIKLGYEEWEMINAGLFLTRDGDITIEGSAMLTFFRASPYNDWVYLNGGQAAPDCQEYASGLLPLAFRNAGCWDSGQDKQSTVGEFFVYPNSN